MIYIASSEESYCLTQLYKYSFNSGDEILNQLLHVCKYIQQEAQRANNSMMETVELLKHFNFIRYANMAQTKQCFVAIIKSNSCQTEYCYV